MWVDLEHPANAGLLAYFNANPWLSPGEEASRDPESIPQPYLDLGTHPDIVERLWKGVTGLLPKPCAWVLHHRPVLVHPWSGVVFAFAQGVPAYALRLPAEARAEAVAAGAKTELVYPVSEKHLDLKTIGEEWVLGNWFDQEPGWCLEGYHLAESYGRR